MVSERGYAAVLVDVVDSRDHPSRSQLQVDLLGSLKSVNDRLRSRFEMIDPFAMSIGDEIQGTLASVEQAIRAAAELRLDLLTRGIESRVGLGWGMIEVYDATRTPLAQDGPAWWKAREAIVAVAGSTSRSRYAARMGAVIHGDMSSGQPEAHPMLPAPREAGVSEALVLAILALMDRTFALLDRQDAVIVLGDLYQQPVDNTASLLGVSESAIPNRRSRNHLREMVTALRELERDT